MSIKSIKVRLGNGVFHGYHTSPFGEGNDLDSGQMLKDIARLLPVAEAAKKMQEGPLRFIGADALWVALDSLEAAE